MTVTYEYYTGTFPGRLIPAGDFPEYEKRAAAEVSHATFRRTDAPDDADIPDAARDAVCAVAEVLYRHDSAAGPRTASEKIGDYAVTYHNDVVDGEACRKEINRTVRTYLGGSWFMERGVAV